MEALTLGLGPTITDNALGTVYKGIWKGRAVCVQSCHKLTKAIFTGIDYGPTEYEECIAEFSRNLDRMQEWKDVHPNVASVQGVVRDPVNHVPTYIIYEFATTSLERCLRESASPVTVTRWKRVWQQLFLGLAHLHNKSPPIVHGNIEPSMIMTREYQDGSVLLWLNAGLGEWKSLMTGATPPSSSFSHSAAENIRSKMKPDNATSIYVPPERALGDPAAIASPQGDVYAAAMVAAYLLVVFLPLKGSKQGLNTELLHPCDETLVRQEDTAYAATRWLRQHKGCEKLADILQLCTRKHPDERPTASDVCKALDLFNETSLLAADGGPTREEILRVSAELVLKQQYDAVVAAERAFLQSVTRYCGFPRMEAAAFPTGELELQVAATNSDVHQDVSTDSAHVPAYERSCFLPASELDLASHSVVTAKPLKDVASVIPTSKLLDDSCDVHKRVLRVIRHFGTTSATGTQGDGGKIEVKAVNTTGTNSNSVALSWGSSHPRTPVLPSPGEVDLGAHAHSPGLRLNSSGGSNDQDSDAMHPVTTSEASLLESSERLHALENAFDDLKAAQTVAFESGVPATGKLVGTHYLNNASSNSSVDVTFGGQYVVESNSLMGCITVYRNPSMDIVKVIWDIDGAPLRRPGCVCFTQPGRIMLAEKCSNRLRECSFDGDHIRLFGTGEVFDLEITGLAFSGDSVAVAHYSEVLLFDYLSGVLLHKLGREGSAVGDLWGCHGISFSQDNKCVAVADGGNHRISVFAVDGGDTWCFGMNQLYSPRDVCMLPCGCFAVADSGSFSVVVFSPDGKRILRRFPSFGNMLEGATAPTALCFDNVHHHLLVLEDMGTLRVFE